MANFPINLTIKAFDQASAKLSGINQKLEGLRSSSARFGAQWKLTSSTLNLGGIGKAIGGVGRGFSALAGGVSQSLGRLALTTSAAGAGLFLLAKNTSEEIDSLSKLSKRLGVGIEAFQELRHAAKLSGISNEEFAKSFGEMNKRIGEAKIGQGALNAVLSKAAPNFLRQLKLAKNNEQAFDLLSKAIFSLKDPTQKAALATAAFGKAGAKMVSLFNEGPDQIRKFREEARKLGLVNKDTAEGAEAFNDNLDRLSQSFESLKIAAIGPLFPALAGLTDEFKNFIVEVRPQVEAFSKNFAAKLPDRLKQLRKDFSSFADSMRPVINFAKVLIEKFGIFNVALAAFATFIGAPLIGPIIALTAAFANLATAMAPLLIAGGATTLVIGGIVVAVAALGAGTYLLIKNWSKVKDFFKTLWQDVLDQFNFAIFGMKKSINTMIDLMPKGVKDIFGIEKFEVAAPKIPGSLGRATGFGPRSIGAAPSEQRERTAPMFGSERNIDLTEINKVLTQKKEVTIQFENAPAGMKVKETGSRDKDFKVFVNQGLQGAYGG